MLNQELRTVTMSRSDMLRVQQALTHMVIDYSAEINDPNTPATRREIAQRSGEMWWRIRCEFERQLNEQDPEEFRRK